MTVNMNKVLFGLDDNEKFTFNNRRCGFLENLVDKMISALLSIALYFITKAILRRIHR